MAEPIVTGFGLTTEAAINDPTATQCAASLTGGGVQQSTTIKLGHQEIGCKRWGVRGIYTFLGGTGLWGVAKEVAQGSVVQYGKRRLATVVIGGATYICAPAVAVITNATRVVKSCKVVYTSIGYVMEAVEDASHIPFLPLDLALFGQPVPANKDGRFSSWSNITDIIDNLPAIGDS
eukprot:scaffold27021_cov2942-Cylindrotheca_fusiformis.AAC.3